MKNVEEYVTAGEQTPPAAPDDPDDRKREHHESWNGLIDAIHKDGVEGVVDWLSERCGRDLAASTKGEVSHDTKIGTTR